MNDKENKAYLCPIIIGLILILVGLFIRTPGGALTTFESLDGMKTDGYVFDNRYTSIDEYVGGDAYNYIIGASLVAGRMTGIIITKAICMVGGTMCLCLGMTLKIFQKKEIIIEKPASNTDMNGAEGEEFLLSKI